MSGKTSAPSRDTIFALASGSGRAGVAVIRVSGPDAGEALKNLTRRPLPSQRTAVIRNVFDLSNGDKIDSALVLRFGAPSSYTGEDVVEFQTHGGPAVVSALLKALGTQPTLRPADPGEFTRRAVLNGRLDLTQAEAIADLVAAETEGQRRQALCQFEGKLGELYEDWRAQLIRAAAWIEAGIDFADEDIPANATADSRATLKAVASEIGAHLNDGRRGEIMRDGLHVAIIGPPNAGKSSLVNALARRDVAIVSETPGTTRDVIEVRLDLGGYPVVLADTAGLREAGDDIEEEGIRRARARAEAADFCVLVLDGTAPASDLTPPLRGRDTITVWNKADLVRAREPSGLWVSAKTGEGLPELIASLTEHAAGGLAFREAPALTRARHRDALEDALQNLARASAVGESELAAEHLRLALRAIGRVTGRVDLDELLDVVFRDFCIGK